QTLGSLAHARLAENHARERGRDRGYGEDAAPSQTLDRLARATCSSYERDPLVLAPTPPAPDASGDRVLEDLAAAWLLVRVELDDDLVDGVDPGGARFEKVRFRALDVELEDADPAGSRAPHHVVDRHRANRRIRRAGGSHAERPLGVPGVSDREGAVARPERAFDDVDVGEALDVAPEEIHVRGLGLDGDHRGVRKSGGEVDGRVADVRASVDDELRVSRVAKPVVVADEDLVVAPPIGTLPPHPDRPVRAWYARFDQLPRRRRQEAAHGSDPLLHAQSVDVERRLERGIEAIRVAMPVAHRGFSRVSSQQ